MIKNVMSLIDKQDIPAALGLLTRIPVSVRFQTAQHRAAHAAWAYPVVGMIVAFIGVCVSWGALIFFDPAIAAAVGLAVSIIITGGLHEDGLADSADGLWGGTCVSSRLDIMKDSRIGTYGVLALVFAIILRWYLLSVLFTYSSGLAWLAAAAVGRAVMSSLMAVIPNARTNGLSAQIGMVRGPTAAVAVAIAGIAVVALFPSSLGQAVLGSVLALGVAGGLCAVCARIAVGKIGGQTGDILGATGVVCETGCLMVMCAYLA